MNGKCALILSLSWAFCSSPFLHALPQDAQVVSGQAQLHAQQDSLTLTTSEKAIIHWNSFSIGGGEKVQFIQPSSSSAVLNRVKGTNPSHLLGQLIANGKVYLINPHGVVFGKDAVIRAADFLASTHDLSDADFLLGQEQLFRGESNEAITNYGTIEAREGNVVLIGRRIDNQGVLLAPQGAVSLAAGQEILLQPEGIAILSIRPALEGGGTISHEGRIAALVAELQAEGQAYTQGINVQGSVVALNPVLRDGRIYLKADGVCIAAKGALEAPEGTISIETTSRGLCVEGSVCARQGSIFIDNSSEATPFYHLGLLDVSGPQGGSVQIDTTKFLNAGKILAEGTLGDGGKIAIHTHESHIDTQRGRLSVSGQGQAGEISLRSDSTLFSSGTFKSCGAHGGQITCIAPQLTLVSADVDASGSQGGGTIFIGGRAHEEPQGARITHLSGDTRLAASATQEGDGGRIVVWSEERTVCWGSIEAHAGPLGGNGGWMEVSSSDDLLCGASMSALAPNGIAGTVLLDPKNLVVDATTGIYPQYELIDPNSGGGTGFGTVVRPLSSGKVVVTKPFDNLGGVNAGAVYLYDGLTAALISTLTGSTAGDQVGSDGVTALTNGNYVIRSTNWDNGAVIDAGAVTWGSGTTGVTGAVSASNSLVGSTASDLVGSGSVTALTNGNYVVASPNWDNGAVVNVGAVTWGNGATGITGAVTSSNSLVGPAASDQVGSTGVVALTNGNYVVRSASWHSGAAVSVGAVTWGNGATGVTGVVGPSNSLVGSTAGDLVGLSVTALTNGNYVVGSPFWDNGAVGNAGAATWGNGATGITGVISSSNSLVGSSISDLVGNGGVTELTNGNYVVRSFSWNNGAAADAGAVTWANGTTGITGVVSSSNSLVGSTTLSEVGIGGVIALTNGNYVVNSFFWDDGAVSNAGAVTWGNGTTGIAGVVSASNSLVGTTASDLVGSAGVVALTNGNYVVMSSFWNNGGIVDAGAVTWVNGATGTTGAVTSSNSLVGSTTSDFVGSGGAVALTNGNYVVRSPFWNNGGIVDAGAVTWGSGTTGVTGAVTSSNSLVGSTASDQVGSTGVVALTNGNYVVRSANWDNGGIVDAGAVTWGSGTTGVTGAVTSSNSLVGSTASDQVGSGGVTALTNGNYVVISSAWDNGGIVDAGAVTWGNGATGVTGAISSSNSLVGSTASDQVGSGGIVTLTNGNYVVRSTDWDNGALAGAGAATFGDGTMGVTGAVSAQNSVVGLAAAANLQTVVNDTANSTFLAPFLAEGSGKIRVGLQTPGQMAFSRAQAQTMTITPSLLTATLNTGTAVSVQANNDLTISSPIVSNPGAGALSLSAGRSVQINANITTGNAALTVTANDLASSGVVDAFRDAGSATLGIANNVMIDTGTGSLTLSLLNGAGKTNTASGNVTIGDNATLQCSGSGAMTVTAQNNDIVLGMNTLLQTANGALLLSAGRDITDASACTVRTTGTGELILITDSLFPTRPAFGSGKVTLPLATLTTGGGRLLIYTSQRLLNTLPATINGTAYVAGPEFVDSATEKWGTYYPNSSGIPFTIFYKQSIASSVTSAASHDAIIAVSEPFRRWDVSWYGDSFLTADSYPPYLTPKPLRLKPLSLVRAEAD